MSGGTYILDRKLTSFQPVMDVSGDSMKTARSYKVCIDGVEEPMTANIIISSTEYLSQFETSIKVGSQTDVEDEERYALGIVVIDCALSSLATTASVESNTNESEDRASLRTDTALLTFPPGELDGGRAQAVVNVLIYGEGTLSCPSGTSR